MASASDVHTFAYDGLGRRVVEAAGGTTTRLLWCGEAICQTRNASDTPMAYHYPQGELRGTQRLYYATDHLGSVREVRNLASGQTLAARDYSPCGATTAQAGSLTPARGFAGMWRHAPTGLYLTHYRAYSPAYGRWLNRDPIFEAGGINLYAYVGNDPVNLTDSSGLFPVWDIVDFYFFVRSAARFVDCPTDDSARDLLLDTVSLLPIVPSLGVIKRVAEVAESTKTAKLADDIADWLGKDARMIKNDAGDHIFVSADGSRRVRFDIERPSPHKSPHAHIEERVGEKWVKSGPVYPKDVPPR